jgi:hypothetical protein
MPSSVPTLCTTVTGGRCIDVEKLTDRLNVLAQGTAADDLKLTLALLWECRDECLGAVPVLVERHLEGRYEIHLQYALATAHPVILFAAGYAYGRKPNTALLEDGHDGRPDAGFVHEQLTLGLGDANDRLLYALLLLSCLMTYSMSEERVDFTNGKGVLCGIAKSGFCH